jgi:hypothetical protein
MPICGRQLAASCPTLPVYYSEIPAPTLGMALEAWDDNGKASYIIFSDLVIIDPSNYREARQARKHGNNQTVLSAYFFPVE